MDYNVPLVRLSITAKHSRKHKTERPILAKMLTLNKCKLLMNTINKYLTKEKFDG